MKQLNSGWTVFMSLPCLSRIKFLVYSDIRWFFMHCIFCSFFQILYRSDLCGVYLVYIHAEGWICEGLNPEMFDAMHWLHLFSIHLLLKILSKYIWIIKPQCGGVLCCWYDLWSHFLKFVVLYVVPACQGNRRCLLWWRARFIDLVMCFGTPDIHFWVLFNIM